MKRYIDLNVGIFVGINYHQCDVGVKTEKNVNFNMQG